MSDKSSGDEQQSERLFIQGYQVFCNEAGQADSTAVTGSPGNTSDEKDPDDLPVTFEVKREPVDPDYEKVASPMSTQSPAATPASAVMPVISVPSPRQRPQLKDVLPRLKQMQQMNASAPVNVIDELVKKNEFLLAKNDTGGYKPYSRKTRNPADLKHPENLMEVSSQTFLVSPTSQARISAIKPETGNKQKDARYGKILRPRSPTRKCSIPEKDKSHFNYALIESNVKDKSSDKIFKVQTHEMVCAVTCKAMFMTQGGAFKGDFDLQFYWCNFCTFHTTNKSQLIQHGMEHRFHCKFCRYQSFSRADIIHHSAKVHADAFRETANSMKYCILLSDYLQIYSQDTDEDRKKRAAPDDEDDGNESPPQKTAKLEGRSVDSLSADELKTLQNDYQIFDMEVETVEEADKNSVTDDTLAASDRQFIADSGLDPYETSQSVNSLVNAETSLQSNILQNITSKSMSNSRSAPIPVSLVASSTRPVMYSKLAAPAVPVGQLLVQNIANTSVKPPMATQTPIQPHPRPPPPPPSNKPKPGPGTTVSSSLYWSCGYCSFTSHSQSEIKEHSQKSHRGKPHRYVALIMPSEKQSQNGQNSEGGKNSHDGNIEIDNAEELADSVPVESEIESFKCFHCSFLVKKPELIKDHLFAKHPSLSMVGVDIHSRRLKNIFYCPRDDCPFRSKNPAMYQSHVERCTPWHMKDLNIAVEKHLLDCLENTIKFSKAVQLKEQVSKKLGELSCIYCLFKSHISSRVKQHVMTKHPLEEKVIQPLQSRSSRFHCLIYFCTLCSWHTRMKRRLYKHMSSSHKIKSHSVLSGKTSGSCSQDHVEKLKVVASNKMEVVTRDAVKKDYKKISCSFENKENENKFEQVKKENAILSESTALLNIPHDCFYTDHTDETVYHCLYCSRKYTGLSAIKTHLHLLHSYQKMQTANVERCKNGEKCIFFICPEDSCRALYTQESMLIKHVLNHKSMQLPFFVVKTMQSKIHSENLNLTSAETKCVNALNTPDSVSCCANQNSKISISESVVPQSFSVINSTNIGCTSNLSSESMNQYSVIASAAPSRVKTSANDTDKLQISSFSTDSFNPTVKLSDVILTNKSTSIVKLPCSDGIEISSSKLDQRTSSVKLDIPPLTTDIHQSNTVHQKPKSLNTDTTQSQFGTAQTQLDTTKSANVAKAGVGQRTVGSQCFKPGSSKRVSKVFPNKPETVVTDTDLSKTVHVEIFKVSKSESEQDTESSSFEQCSLSQTDLCKSDENTESKNDPAMCDVKQEFKSDSKEKSDSVLIDDVVKLVNVKCDTDSESNTGFKDSTGMKTCRKKCLALDELKYICKFCEFSHKNALAVKLHITDKHPGKKLEMFHNNNNEQKMYFMCPVKACTFFFPEKINLVQHWQMVHEKKAKTVKKSTERDRLSSGSEVSPDSKNKMLYECLYCFNSHMEPDLKTMKRHYEEKHEGQVMIMRDLKIASLRNSRIIVCSHPECMFWKNNVKDEAFQYHQLAHKNLNVYECSMCDWFTHDKCEATEHILLAHSKRRVGGLLSEFRLKLQKDGSVTKIAVKS